MDEEKISRKGAYMASALRISTRNINLRDAVRTDIEKHAMKLEKYSSDITDVKVSVEVPHRPRQTGKLFSVKLDIKVPGKDIVIRKEENRDLYSAVRDAFFAAYRQLEKWNRKRRGDIKRHEETPNARVSSLFTDEGYGFIATPDGREIYFHENSVLNDNFKHLSVGIPVRYVEEMGEEGPQASTVSL